MPTTPILEICDVSYVAGSTTILDRVSWRIDRGEHWAVLGPNGAGKTTLLQIACGYRWPNAGGMVRRCGQQLVDLRQLRRSIGWISSLLVGEIPVHERVLDTVVSGRFAQLGLKKMTWDPPTDQDYKAAHGYLDQLGCAELAQKPFGVLSQGEQQKALIARARMAQPLLIILDEPCAGMDPGARERFLGTLAELTQLNDGLGLVLVTHHMEEIMPGLDKTLILDHGRVVRSGITHAVIDASVISQLYGVHVSRLVEHNGRLWPIF